MADVAASVARGGWMAADGDAVRAAAGVLGEKL